MLILLPFISFLFLGMARSSEDEPMVETPLGKVRGYTMTSRSGRKVSAFSGIPYAKPPVGDLRLKAPVAASPWSGVLDAKEELPVCIQFSSLTGDNIVIGVEDCLYLSVFTHDVSRKAPVLVFMHGGAFKEGAARVFHPQFLLDEDIVLVMLSFRIGIYGFLTFETSEMPGNQGMKDQVLALKWVQENIASFGGDPNRVTINGVSAGAASIYHHIVSPLTKGLFHGAIVESGASYCTWALIPPGKARACAEKLMTLVGCPTNPDEAIPCVMGKDANEVVPYIANFTEWQMDPIANFAPVLEPDGPDSFLTGPISKWEHKPIPMLMSVTSAEGLFRTIMFLKSKTDFEWLSEHIKEYAAISLMYDRTASNPDKVTETLMGYYLPSPKFEPENVLDFWHNLTTMIGDGLFIIPSLEAADKHKGDVYFYYFDYLPEYPYIPKELDPFIKGVIHCAEIMYIWNCTYPGFSIPLEGKDLMMSKSLVKAVTTFVKTGVPEVDGLKWEKWTPENHYYVAVDKSGLHLEKGLAEDRYEFWNSINYKDLLE